jgi:hypothetical protein
MDGLIDQLAAKASLHGYVSLPKIDIGDLQNSSFNFHTNRQGLSGRSLSAAGTQRLFQFS